MSEDNSTTVRKVADYIEENYYPELIDNYDDYRKIIIEDAKEIIKIVHESEDADE